MARGLIGILYMLFRFLVAGRSLALFAFEFLGGGGGVKARVDLMRWISGDC